MLLPELLGIILLPHPVEEIQRRICRSACEAMLGSRRKKLPVEIDRLLIPTLATLQEEGAVEQRISGRAILPGFRSRSILLAKDREYEQRNSTCNTQHHREDLLMFRGNYFTRERGDSTTGSK
jgi:hypothetical protein